MERLNKLPVTDYPSCVSLFLKKLSEYNSEGTWVGGGAARSLLTLEPIKDLDVFFESGDSRSRFYNHFKLDKSQVYFKNTVCGIDIDCSTVTTHPIHVFLEKTDFTICQFAFDHTGQFFGFDQAYNDTLNKKLVVNCWEQRCDDMVRRAKMFIQKGYDPGMSEEQFLRYIPERIALEYAVSESPRLRKLYNEI